MSRRIGLLCSSVIVMFVALYLASYSYTKGDTLNVFLNGYLNEPQKYLFLLSMFITSIFLSLFVPYFEPVIHIRLKGDIFSYILKYGAKISLFIAILLFGIFFMSGMVIGLEFNPDLSCIVIIGKLFLFVLCMFLICNTLYFITKKKILAIFISLVVNFGLLMLIYGIDFYTMNNEMNKNWIYVLYEVYIMVGILGSGIYLYKNAEKEVCISQEK